MALIIATWIWGSKYTADYVGKLARGIRRNMRTPYRFIVATPQWEDEWLTQAPGCLARLRMFDPHWQHRQGLRQGDRLVTIDLDVVITGDLSPLFDLDASFVILGGANAANPCPYNGSIMMLTCGEHAQVWCDFSLEAIRQVPFYEFPDDQAWLAHKLPGAVTWRVGASSGIYAFKKPGWPRDDRLPADARMVVFPGWRDPAKFTRLSWVQRHWI